MLPNCPHCNYPTIPDKHLCLACGKPIPPDLPMLPAPKKRKKRKAKRKSAAPDPRDNDPTAS